MIFVAGRNLESWKKFGNVAEMCIFIRELKERKEMEMHEESYEEVNAHIRGILTVGWHAKAPQIRGRKALRDQARSRRSSDRDRT